MLKVYLGNFHPDLEDALCNYIISLKGDDHLAPLAIVVPSIHLRSRLKIMFSSERRLDLINIHFYTFHTLSAKLYEERYGVINTLVKDDFFFEELLRHTIKTSSNVEDTFRHLSETRDGCSTLWKTIQDLKDARVDPDNLMEAIREGVFNEEDIERLSPLVLLYKEFLLRMKEINIMDYSDLPVIAAELVPTSGILHSFKEIIYYGFYDLTQVQYDLFRSVANHYPATLYFPLIEKMQAFEFARRFYEGYIQGMVPGKKAVIRLSEPVIMKSGAETTFPFGHISTIISTSGAEDEVLTVAKAIYKLVDMDGCSFSDFGVVSRDINDYGHLIKRIFDIHKIPFVSSACDPINRYQVTKAVHLFLSVPEGDYRRSDIIDLASSHFCRIETFCPDGVEPRPDIWDYVTRSAGISRGISEWERLDKYIRDGLVLNEKDEESAETHRISGDIITGLKNFVSSLNEDFDNLPEISSWDDYAERFEGLIQKYIAAEGFIIEGLYSIREFRLISSEVTLNEFIDTFKRMLENRYIPVSDNEVNGVHVLDVMAARGITCKVLFVLGMNEKVFPRNIKEDPMLRDSLRKVFEAGLGYKVTEKLSGYDEEKLLFYLLLSSARERIYLLYQRTDEAGQTKVPSMYLNDIRKGFPVNEENIPRRTNEKFSVSEYFDYSLLIPQELSLRLISESRDALPVIMKFNMAPETYRHGINVIQRLETRRPALTAYDGLTGPIEKELRSLIIEGTSPTSLESYARCPFSYFAHHILSLRRLSYPDPVCEIPPIEIGNICHRILKRIYSRGEIILKKDIDIEGYLREDSSVVFNEFQQDHTIGYPLLWAVLKKRLMSVIKSMITDDINELRISGFIPSGFELNETGYLDCDGPGDLNEIRLHGIVDRIDIKPGTGIFRIIDYKYKSGTGMSNEDRNLSLSAVRGKKLQPPLYILMIRPHVKSVTGVENPLPEKVSFYFIAPAWTSDDKEERVSEFPGDCWQTGLGEQIKSSISLLLKGIKEGLFFIYPGGYCDFCDYYMICRKNHTHSRSRSERDERVRPYYSLRKNNLQV